MFRGLRGLRRAPVRPIVPVRALTISPRVATSIKGWGMAINIIGGAYIGGLIVCFGLLYFLYQDADSRQKIPFELSITDQITAVKALNKDEALSSPRYAVKHYRRLLIELAKHEGIEFTECDDINDSRYFKVPLIPSDILVNKKSTKFANFYIDMVARYSKALLAKGELDISVQILRDLIHDDTIFYRLGDAERLSQCCRLLAKLSSSIDEKEELLAKSVNMIKSTFSSILLDEHFYIQPNSRITDELLSCLNDLAFDYAKQASPEYLSRALKLYLSNLKVIQSVQENITTGTLTQANFPLFNCDEEHLTVLSNEIKSHVSEIMWAKGYYKNAISWNEEIIDDVYYLNSTNKKLNEILLNVLNNLVVMYEKQGNKTGEKRSKELLLKLKVYEHSGRSWYDNTVNRFAKIIYHKGPLGVLEKGIIERFGPPKRLLEIEEFEDEDRE